MAIGFGALWLGSATAASAEQFATATAAATKPPRGGLHVAAQSTRFVIGLARKTDYQVFSLNNPNRVIVDLKEASIQLPSLPSGETLGLVKSFRGGETAPGQTRVVIDVSAPVVVERAIIERSSDGQSSRLVIDIAPAAQQSRSATAASAAPAPAPLAKAMRAGASGLGATAVQPPMPKAAQRRPAVDNRTYRPLIVLDPGHGGHDSGAQKFGTVEKDVVLAFGQMLRDKLTASGRYRVLMTRENDSFVELDERREFAEKHRAALFIAIHADYAGTSANGATIYSLRESVAESLKRSARGTVRDRVLAGGELAPIKAEGNGEANIVKGFLADLAQREVDSNKDRTNVFAQSIIAYMGRSTTLRDNPDRSAAFRVLKTAQVPAVLIELAYVSNPQDAQNLRSLEWRRKVSDSIMTAIDNYFADQSTRVPM